MLCTKCNSEIKTGKKFCGICGTPAVVPERRCGACNTKLDEGENFCPDCGTKYSEAPAAKSQTSGKSQVVGSDSVCLFTTKGSMAVIGDTIFFKHNDKIYSTSMSNAQKAKVLIDRRNFLSIEDEYEDYPIEKIGNLNAWNGKLYFYVNQFCNDDGDEAIFGKNRSTGVFSYCPKTNKLELIDKLEGCQDAHVVANKAYACRKLNEENAKIWRTSVSEKHGRFSPERDKVDDVCPTIFVTIDLETKQKTEEFMPILTLEDWPDLTWATDGKPRARSDWHIPFYNNGYIYTSCFGALAPIRYPVGNLEKRQLLKSGLSPCWEGYLRKPLAACGDVVMMFNYNTDSVDFFSNTTLQTLNTFESNPISHWQTYGGNYFVFSKNNGDKTSSVYKVDEAKLLGSVDVVYSKMVDAIYFNNTTYALGNLCLEDEEGEVVYNDLALYRIPWNKMFKADTNLDDFVQPLFDNTSEC